MLSIERLIYHKLLIHIQGKFKSSKNQSIYYLHE